MEFTKEMVDDFAEKLLIGLTDEENKMVLDEFNIIDKNISIINEIDGIDEMTPMTHALDDFHASFREDIVEESIEIEKLLSNCDLYSGREVEVPKVVG